MSVDDHGIEVLKKSGEEVTPGDKSDYYIKVAGVPGGVPVPVVLTDGVVNIGTVNAEIEVQLSHQNNVPDAGDIADSVRVGDGVEELAINSDNEALVHDLDTHTRIGSLTETAPVTDTGSSGLNGRLQRIAQHLTTIQGYTDGIEALVAALDPRNATASNTRPTVTSTSSTVLASNSNRKHAHFINNNPTTIFLKLGATAVAGEGIPLGPGGMYEITFDKLYTGAVNAIKTGASASLEVFEGTA